jgi:hypothetical protein
VRLRMYRDWREAAAAARIDLRFVDWVAGESVA